MASSQADIDACGVPAPSTVDSDAVDEHAPTFAAERPSAAVL
ncbi:hypothetical protein O4160_22320 [Rhodococcus sp. IEGM 1401]|nr:MULTISPECIES: hypothetical protein [unclassified Rhodococcus (in: high G+C Gram-positive bacteria)]MCZ4563579.1 hypothetical protein [Rhodococcus sp. IEGM 1401]MDI9923728.1 hypothetical protein [Rhodococcus sp. IEGM 1372]MDV8036194.1 hypothetical protein [Rhodococcus sp. IEGM 1414]